MASTIRGTDNLDSATVATDSELPVAGQLAKAWCHWDQTTDSIFSSYNVSSVTDSGTGRNVINFITPFGTYFCGTGAMSYGSTSSAVNADFYVRCDSSAFIEVLVPYSAYYDSNRVHAVFYSN